MVAITLKFVFALKYISLLHWSKTISNQRNMQAGRIIFAKLAQPTTSFPILLKRIGSAHSSASICKKIPRYNERFAIGVALIVLRLINVLFYVLSSLNFLSVIVLHCSFVIAVSTFSCNHKKIALSSPLNECWQQ